MAKRFQTYFGIPIPPFKERKLGAGSITIRFVLTGKVPSKKNNTMAVSVRKDARKFINDVFTARGAITKGEAHAAIKKVFAKVRPNQDYQDFVEKQKPVIQAQALYWSKRLQVKGLIFPLPKATMSVRFYFSNRYIQDTVNKQQSIQDLLIASQVIANDDYATLNPIHAASACYYEEITEGITFISLSFRL